MKNKLRFFCFVFGAVLLSLAVEICADAPATVVTRSDSVNSSVGRRYVKEPMITNEAEYAEFVRKNEKAGQASSVRSTSLQMSTHSTGSVVSSSTSSSRGKHP